MISVAALVLGSSLMAMSGAPGYSGEDRTAMEPRVQLSPNKWEITRAKERRAGVNQFLGVALELGSLAFHLINADAFVGRDLKLSAAGCNASDNPCGGPPFVLLIPAGATTMGWIGAARLAESREANLRNSPLFWLGTAVELGAYVLLAAGGRARSGDRQLALDTTFVSMAIVGTILQVMGAFTGPTRAEVEAAP